ncbi:MAG: hypothetical protein ACFE9T_12335 [Promethearchaeota archaeon]
MEINETIIQLRKFIENQSKTSKKLTTYKAVSDLSHYFNELGISVDLNKNKEIILQDETQIELGGLNRKSFSLVYPSKELNQIEDGKITLLGPEIQEINESSVDFGFFLLIKVKSLSEQEYSNLRALNFISNGIEGFLIRTIPRKFWCRISKNVIKKNFSFEFLGNAIFYLYRQKFENLIEAMEVIFINSYPNLIDEFMRIISEIIAHINYRWIQKIEKWRKRIDCEYDWACEICPYQQECYEVKQVLIEREKISNIHKN